MRYGKKHEKDNVSEEFYEELFAEWFANYMMTGMNEMHNENFEVLRVLIPELRG